MKEIIKAFGIKGEIQEMTILGDGGIHRTYRVRMNSGDRYVLQKINTEVFRKPEEVMQNSILVTEYLKEHHFRTLEFHQTESGSYLYQDWRLMNNLDGYSMKNIEDFHQIRQTGEAFGRFQKAVSGMEAGRLKEVISGFHDTENYYQELENLNADLPESEMLLSWKDQACSVCEAYRIQDIAYQVTHGDMKCSNLLFSHETNQPLAVIDLDTVMPGMAVYDFGDAVRSISRNGLNLEKFKYFAEGWLNQIEYTEPERKLLIASIFSVTVELAVRYLTDYLRGNIYFRTDQPELNLIRARNQIRLANELLKHQTEMEDFIYGIYRSSQGKKKHPEVFG